MRQETQQATRIKVGLSSRTVILCIIGFSIAAGVVMGGLVFPGKKKTPTPIQILTITLEAPTYTIGDPTSPQAQEGMAAIRSDESHEITTEIGKPRLPLIRTLVALPPDVKVEQVTLIPIADRTEPLEKPIAPVQATDLPRTVLPGVSEEIPPPVDPDEATYATANLFPGSVLQGHSQNRWGPFEIVEVTFAPYQYMPTAQALTVHDQMALTVTYRATGTTADLQGLIRDYITADARTTVENPDDLERWYGKFLEEPPSFQDETDLAIIRPDVFWEVHSETNINLRPRDVFAASETKMWRAAPGYNNISYLDGEWRWMNFGSTQVRFYGIDGLPDGTAVVVGQLTGQGPYIATHAATAGPTDFTTATVPDLPGTNDTLQDVSVVSPTSAWAVGNNDNAGFIFTTNNLTNWAQATTPPVARLMGIYAASPSAIWAVGDNGMILFFNGSTWTIQNAGVTRNLQSVHGTTATNVWAVGEYGTILHFDGAAWNNLSSTSPNSRDGLGSHRVYTSVLARNDGSVWIGSRAADPNIDAPILLMGNGSTPWIIQFLGHEKQSLTDAAIYDLSTIPGTNEVVAVKQNEVFRSNQTVDPFAAYRAYRESQGYRITEVTLADITAQYPVPELVERIRAYLLDQYEQHGLTHALIAGSGGLVPRGYTLTDNDTAYRNVGDPYGEPELFVSRVPTDDPASIAAYLNRVIASEARNDPYQHQAMLTAGFDLHCLGAGNMERMRQELFEPRGWNVTTLYDPNNQIPSTDVLNQTNVRSYWNGEHPSFVSMEAHGSYQGVSNTLEQYQIRELNDAFPAHVAVSNSCSTIGYDSPHTYASFGVSLTQNGGVSYLGATNAILCGTQATNQPYFQRLIDDGQSVAEAFEYGVVGAYLMPLGDPLVRTSKNAVSFLSPLSESIHRAVASLDIVGSVLGQGFESFTTEWGQGQNPSSWSTAGIVLTEPTERKVAERLATWDTTQITDVGTYSLRITAILNGQPVSRTISLTIDNQVCVDGTPPQQCSVTQPRFCEGGQLPDRCGSPENCGCPNPGDTCLSNGSCGLGCPDGTPIGQCSEPPGSYCTWDARQINLLESCAGENGVAHDEDDCDLCGYNGTYCRAGGFCVAGIPRYGLSGDYYQGANFETLVNENVIDPVMDFGPVWPGQYLPTLLAEPGRANTTGLASVRWDGYIYVPTNESITYYLNCGGGMRCSLFIDSLTQPILDINWASEAARTLSQGWHPIRVEMHRENVFPGTGMQVGWKVGGGTYVQEMGGQMQGIPVTLIIPNEALAPVIPTVPSSSPVFLKVSEPSPPLELPVPP